MNKDIKVTHLKLKKKQFEKKIDPRNKKVDIKRLQDTRK